VRGRTGLCIVLALLLAGCAASGSRAGSTNPATTDQTDVWFMQYMVPHLPGGLERRRAHLGLPLPWIPLHL
jgi:hypothetical protein